ncbi:MAG: OmpH family outer membrane protein [Deltaproteobacteria bacterium]|nr:OmpH family outer membrane protein [Deltaproteobacteria bacterium]
MRLNRALIALVGVLGFSLSAHAADIKIGVVDLQKALQSVESGKNAKSTLEKEFNEKKKALQAEEEAIKKMTEDFKKQSLVLSDEAKGRKQGEIQERLVKYRELFSKSQYDIQQRERQLTEPIIGKLRGLVEDLGKKNGYTVILEKNENNVLFSQPGDDLTEEIIKGFNKKHG